MAAIDLLVDGRCVRTVHDDAVPRVGDFFTFLSNVYTITRVDWTTEPIVRDQRAVYGLRVRVSASK